MKELIPIQTASVDGGVRQTVNARDLHAFLESKRQFSNWITYQIEAFSFTQDVDFVVKNNFVPDVTAFGGQRKTTEYHLTLDMAKELSMVERSAKGKEARLYFIECERIAKAAPQIPQFSPDPIVNALMASLHEIGTLKTKLSNLSHNTRVIRDTTQTVVKNLDHRLKRLEEIAATKVRDPAPITRGNTRRPFRDRKGMMTRTELGKHFNATALQMTEELIARGLMTSAPRQGGRRVYELTAMGKAYGVMLHTNGDLVPEGSTSRGAQRARTIVWLPEVVSFIAEQRAAA
jgi:anti-repressor protein